MSELTVSEDLDVDSPDPMDAFADSPEAAALEDLGWIELAELYASEWFDESPATLIPTQLEEVVFELFPRKVTCEPSSARAAIEQLRALYAFLARTADREHAEACAAVLGGDAVERLERELADPRNYGMAKSLAMSGMRAGFDMRSDEGIAAFAALSALGPTDRPRVGRTVDARARKNKRKAERKARRKNR